MKNHYLLHRDTSHNPYLQKRKVSWPRWVAKQVSPLWCPSEYIYFKTLKEAIGFFNKDNAKWERI